MGIVLRGVEMQVVDDAGLDDVEVALLDVVTSTTLPPLPKLTSARSIASPATKPLILLSGIAVSSIRSVPPVPEKVMSRRSRSRRSPARSVPPAIVVALARPPDDTTLDAAAQQGDVGLAAGRHRRRCRNQHRADRLAGGDGLTLATADD